MKKIFFLILVLLNAAVAQAITFDIWQTGISRQEVIAIARNHNLPIRKYGHISPGKGFNPALVQGDADSYTYFTTLVDQPAYVDLLLSPRKDGYGQFLYEIQIRFTNIIRSRDFPPYMLRLLQEKYGRGNSEANLIQKNWVWHPEPDGEVRLLMSPGTLQVRYIDQKIATFAAELRKSTQGLPRKPRNHPDSDRF